MSYRNDDDEALDIAMYILAGVIVMFLILGVAT